MFLTDSFTGVAGTEITAHAGELGASVWTSQGGAVSAVITDANRLRSNGAAAGNFYYARGNPATADYWVEAPIYIASVANFYAGVGGRMLPATNSGYWAIYRTSSLHWELCYQGTVLGFYAQTLTPGQTYTVRLDMVGTTIRLLVDGVQRVSVTDATLSVKGKAGIICFGTMTNTTGMHLDSISASSTRPAANLVVCDGDSITLGLATNTLPWPLQLATDLGATWNVQNISISGQTLADMEADGAGNTAACPDFHYSEEYDRNVLVCLGGTNDVWQNADASDAAATTIARVNTYCTNRKARFNRPADSVIVCTMLPRKVTTGSLPAVQQTHFNDRRAAFNTSVRANFLTYANQLADVGADPTMGDDGDNLNLTYYQGDGVHPENAGATILKDIIKAQVEPPVAGIVVAWPWSVPPLPTAANPDPAGSTQVRADMRRMRR